MKIFDLHADIGYDIYNQHLLKNEDHFLAVLNKLVKAEVYCVCCACFFTGNEEYSLMQEMVLFLKNQIEKNKAFIQKHNMEIIMSIEGMCPVYEDVNEKVQWLYDQGVRMISLCWNDENALATGKMGSTSRGVTKLGYTVLKKMEQLGIVLDISHANEKTFWDCLEVYGGKIMASHSNARALCDVERNLSDKQLCAIASKNGVIGLNACKLFVSDQEKLQTVDTLAKHAVYIANLVGINHVCLGFDFMDFEYQGSVKSMMVKELESACCAQRMIQGLRKYFNEDQIKQIAYKNAERIFGIK